MTKKKLLIAAALAATALGGAAVTANAMIERGPMKADTNGDGIVSRSEFFTAAETRFKNRDTNGDRKLTGDELKDKRGRFARLDANNDGTLTFAEEAAGTAAAFKRMDADGDGKLTPEEMGPRHGRGGPGGPGGPGERGGPAFAQGPDGDGPGMGAGLLRRLDTNNDGKITREEMRAQADQRFDRLDVNKDGAIDQAELQAARGPGRRGLDARDLPPPPAPAAAEPQDQ